MALMIYNLQILSQNGFPVHGVDQGYLHPGELNICWHQVNTLRMVQNTLTELDGRIAQHLAHHVRERDRKRVRARIALANRQATLEIAVNQQHLFYLLCQSDAEIGAGRCLVNAALLVGNAIICVFIVITSIKIRTLHTMRNVLTDF